MAQRALEQRVENLEHRVATVEQILPTLATKADLAELRIATKADLAELRDTTKADLAELRNATKADLAELRDATKADLAELRDTTKADLAELKTELRVEWKADLDTAMAPLATKAEVTAEIKAEGEQTRRYFDVVAEGLRAEIRLIADGHTATQASINEMRTDITRVLDQHDRRLLRLEGSRKHR